MNLNQLLPYVIGDFTEGLVGGSIGFLAGCFLSLRQRKLKVIEYETYYVFEVQRLIFGQKLIIQARKIRQKGRFGNLKGLGD